MSRRIMIPTRPRLTSKTLALLTRGQPETREAGSRHFTHKPGVEVRYDSHILARMEGVLQAVVLPGAVVEGKMPFKVLDRRAVNKNSLPRYPIPALGSGRECEGPR